MKYRKTKIINPINPSIPMFGVVIGRRIFHANYTMDLSVFVYCMTPVNAKRYLRSEWKSVFYFYNAHIQDHVRLGLGEDYEI